MILTIYCILPAASALSEKHWCKTDVKHWWKTLSENNHLKELILSVVLFVDGQFNLQKCYLSVKPVLYRQIDDTTSVLAYEILSRQDASIFMKYGGRHFTIIIIRVPFYVKYPLRRPNKKNVVIFRNPANWYCH